MTDNINILDKTPEQIFNELTANMDAQSRYGYTKIIHDSIFAGSNSLWKIIRFLYAIFGVYSPDIPYTEQAKQIHNICNKLYVPIGNVPKYLRGVLNKRTSKYNHPYDREYIVKPMRGMSQQYITQYRKVMGILRQFERVATIPEEVMILPIISELYTELTKLVSMTRVCKAPKPVRDIMQSGSVQMLQEYNLYAVDTVSNAVQNRCDIIEKYRSSNNNVHRFLRQLQDQEMDRLNKRHDEEQKSVKNFEEFQAMLRRQEQECSDLLKSQREKTKIHKQVFEKKQWQIDQARKFEKIKAQMMMARITRMH
jgi:hypothetical protein